MLLDITSYSDPEAVGGYTNCVEGEGWILWEHTDGSVHVGRTEGRGTGVDGEITVIPKP